MNVSKVDGRAALFLNLAKGARLEKAIIRAVKEFLKSKNVDDAVRLSYASKKISPDLFFIASGLNLLQEANYAESWSMFNKVNSNKAVNLAPVEFFTAGFQVEPELAAKKLESLLKEKKHNAWSALTLLRVAQKSFGRGFFLLSEKLIKTALSDDRKNKGSDHVIRELKRLLAWMPSGAYRSPIARYKGVNFGVLNYRQPHYSSKNIGDWIQTLASLGHLTRHQNLTFDGDAELVDFVKHTQSSIKEELKSYDVTGQVSLVEVHRDGNIYQDIPSDTWCLAFGWYMHDSFGQGYNFPFHNNLRPILISFHVNKPEMLTPDGIAYMKKYGPVGCRDWQSVAVLKSCGVPAFFSGCITTTVDAIFDRNEPDTRTETAYVDAPKDGPGVFLHQLFSGVRNNSLAANLGLAKSWVSEYHLNYKKVVTSRLHSFLPSRSVGCDVVFSPKNRSDLRFGGLIDTSDQEFDAIRNNIREKLNGIIPKILAGCSEEEVYSEWRQLCEPDVQFAENYLDDYVDLVLPEEVFADVRDKVIAVTLPDAVCETNLVFNFSHTTQEDIINTLKHVNASSSDKLMVWLSEEDVDPQTLEMIKQDLSLDIALYSVDRTALKAIHGDVLLPSFDIALWALLGGIANGEKLIVINGPAYITGDLVELGNYVSKDIPVAACEERRKSRQSGFRRFRRISSRQGNNNNAAMDFIKRSHSKHRYDFVPLDDTVMVFDISATKEKMLSRHAIAISARFSLSLSDACCFLFGSNYSVLPANWCCQPQFFDECQSPGVISWRHVLPLGGADVVPHSKDWALYGYES